MHIYFILFSFYFFPPLSLVFAQSNSPNPYNSPMFPATPFVQSNSPNPFNSPMFPSTPFGQIGTVPIGSAQQTQDGNSNSLNRNCGQPQFACGECESNLQNQFNNLVNGTLANPPANNSARWSDQVTGDGLRMKPGQSVSDFMKQVTELFRSQSPNGQLNQIIIGESQSLHGTSPGFPRIAIKSPNSELWVTYNTDPNANGYNKVEIMRWDGKQAKYIFQELNFDTSGSHQGGTVNNSGAQCIQCHKQPARPIWDTYRSWPGIIPPRDDLLEADGNPPNRTIDANGRAYLDLLRRVATAKESPDQNELNRRLSILDVPQIDGIQNNLSPSERIDAITQRTLREGWLRIPHNPPTARLQNVDQKTAPLAGPSHLAFDQLMGQQICAISNNLRNHPQFDKFKYAVAGIMRCDRVYNVRTRDLNASQILEYTSPIYQTRAARYYRNQNPLRDQNGRRIEGTSTPTSLVQSLHEDTLRSHNEENDHKQNLHRRYLTEFSERFPALAANESQITDLVANRRNDPQMGVVTAIRDPGGVRGVAESDPGTISRLRYVLEPLGVDVSGWSMSRGAAAAGGRSYSFSDQFAAIFSRQSLINEIMDSVPGSTLQEKCQNISRLSRTAMDSTQQTQPTDTTPPPVRGTR